MPEAPDRPKPPKCTNKLCRRLATWMLVSQSDPTVQQPVCKNCIPVMMQKREEHALYPLDIVSPFRKEEM